jgi:uroporphyrinogen III methyltransferase/synthase
VTVYLVGAGSGDPGLLTVRAQELIGVADVVVYDRLIPDGVLDGARPDAMLIFAGKAAGATTMPQEEINRLLVEHGGAGKAVVRLKGGDPFVFGRGGEEAEALRGAGVPFEVVPGVTAGVAAAAYAGIPVTHRSTASAVAFVTGHEDPGKPQSSLDWHALARFPGTLVFYMGVRRLAAIADQLLQSGRNQDEPAAMIERGTMPTQRVQRATLATIAASAEAAGMRSPAVAVFGEVAALGDELDWFQAPPLAGIKVVVTRAREQASELAATLRSLGAEVVQAPAIRIVDRPGTVPDFGQYDLLCLTSANGVRVLFDRIAAQDLDARALAALRVAAIGPGTAAALAERGIIADVVPERYLAEGLIEALGQEIPARVLIARAAGARDTLPEGLRQRGSEVDVEVLYDTVAEPLGEPRWPTRTT